MAPGPDSGAVGLLREPTDVAQPLADSLLFLVGALSGPFCILLAPLILIFWWVRRQPWSLLYSAS